MIVIILITVHDIYQEWDWKTVRVTSRRGSKTILTLFLTSRHHEVLDQQRSVRLYESGLSITLIEVNLGLVGPLSVHFVLQPKFHDSGLNGSLRGWCDAQKSAFNI